MSHRETVARLARQPEALEGAYHDALAAGETAEFAAAVDAGYAEDGENLLLAAWHFRLARAAVHTARRVIAWAWVIPVAVVNGLVLWALSGDRFMLRIPNLPSAIAGSMPAFRDVLPGAVLLAAPISAVAIILLFHLVGDRRPQRSAAVVVGLAVVAIYALLTYRRVGPTAFQEQVLAISVANLAALAWAGVGIVLLGRRRDDAARFGFLAKSLEFGVFAGLFAVVGVMFTAISFGLFDALDVEVPELIARLFAAGGAGLIAVVAAGVVYDPQVEPGKQTFDEGLGKIAALLMRLLLPLALVVLAVFLAFVPLNFREPFENREVLVIFNAMLFAVVGLLVGITPVRVADLEGRTALWLRRGVIALVVMALAVGIYALAAILYRTSIDRLTPNRLSFIGWNVINVGFLAWFLVRQIRAGRPAWLAAVHGTFATWMPVYVAWALVTLLALPWMFQLDRQSIEGLPVEIQQLVYDNPYPILLKCGAADHIYLLDAGTKHWVKDIPTFHAQGYQWRDVKILPCEELRQVADGAPIPPDAGTPPPPLP